MTHAGSSPTAATSHIWAYALGYFLAYIPYAALTKALSRGYLGVGLSELELLPSSLVASSVSMVIILATLGWWKYAAQVTVMGISLPRPTRWTLLSGIATGFIIVTTTMAYANKGVSIVFAALFLRGGVLVVAPVVDLISGRKVRWFHWVALTVSVVAVSLKLLEGSSSTPSASHAEDLVIFSVIVTIYLTAYALRLRLMSRFGKSTVREQQLKYFVEEQIVASPSMLVFLGIFALIGGTHFGLDMQAIRSGFELLLSPVTSIGFWAPLVVGVLSQLTGVFGTMVFLDNREHSFAVPVNRSASMLAGVVAAFISGALFSSLGAGFPSALELVGAAMLVATIVFLAEVERRQKKAP